jgi:hypothetical protein
MGGYKFDDIKEEARQKKTKKNICMCVFIFIFYYFNLFLLEGLVDREEFIYLVYLGKGERMGRLQFITMYYNIIRICCFCSSQ